MTDYPFISVIIATHSRLWLLKKALAALAKQTYPANSYEIIVVDDASIDETPHYLAEAAEAGTLRYHTQKQSGSAAARNRGVEMAQGEIVAFTDEDCLPEPDWLMALAESFTTIQPPPVAVGGHIENVVDGHWLRLFFAMQQRHYENKAAKPTYLDSANAAFKRSLFVEMGGFDETFPHPAVEDVDLGYRFRAAGHQFYINPQAFVWHLSTTSLRRLTMRALQTGYGYAFLIVQYSHFLGGPPSRGWRSVVRALIDAWLNLTYRFPMPVRPVASAIVATIRCFILTLPEIQLFTFTYFPQLMGRYRAFGLNTLQTLPYLLVEWYDYTLKLSGRFIGTFKQTYQQVKEINLRHNCRKQVDNHD